MTRVTCFVLLLLGMISTARAELPVAPAPREIREDGTRDPVPVPEVVKKENPLEVVERIIKNSKDVGDKLAMTDTGSDTRKTQDKILKDIDALLNQDDPPPMSDKDKDKDKDKNKDNKPDPSDKKMDMMPMTGMGEMPPKKMDMMPMSGMDDQPMGDQPKERRPRQGSDSKQDTQPKDPGTKGGSSKEKDKKDDTPSGGNPKDPAKQPGGGVTPKGGKQDPSPVIPFETDVVKDVWGHLPDKLRQQATQYYKEEFMARYSNLLKMYYSSLAEKK